MQKKAKLRCMHLLERKDYTEKELRDKLTAGKTDYSQEEIDGAIEYVKSFRYVDDARYAEQYIHCMGARKSRKQIEMELLRKGVDRELVQNAFEESDEISEEEQIENWIRKRNFDPETADIKERQRMYAFLVRKGFRSDNINRALRVEFS